MRRQLQRNSRQSGNLLVTNDQCQCHCHLKKGRKKCSAGKEFLYRYKPTDHGPEVQTLVRVPRIEEAAVFKADPIISVTHPTMRLRLPYIMTTDHGYLTSYGMRVLTVSHADGLHYPGRTVGCASERYVTVRMADCVREIPVTEVINISGAVACPSLSVKDAVLVRVHNIKLNCMCYVPGRVLRRPDDSRRRDLHYFVEIYIGLKACTHRNSLVKISDKMYDKIVSRIAAAHNNNGRIAAAQNDNGRIDAAQNDNGRIDAAQNDNGRIDAAQNDNGDSNSPEHEPTHEDAATRYEQPENANEEAPDLPYLLKLRQKSSELQADQKVLARCSLDGWYYKGTILENCGDKRYKVKDEYSGVTEAVWRENILSESETNALSLNVGDLVVGKHPLHRCGFAPAKVLSVDEICQTGSVKFFDGQTKTVTKAEMFRLPDGKYPRDVVYMQRMQSEIRGKSAVVRHNDSGLYLPGLVVDVDGAKFTIRWSDGSVSAQFPIHVFCAVKHQPRLVSGSYVLAMAHPDKVIFLPGQVADCKGDGVIVDFCDGQREIVSANFCYGVSMEYYQEASHFWKNKQSVCIPRR